MSLQNTKTSRPSQNSRIRQQVEELVLHGTVEVTWLSPGVDDFIEDISSVVCEDVYQVLTRIHSNWYQVEQLATSWSKGERTVLHLSTRGRFYG